jgi:hypothetical protein
VAGEGGTVLIKLTFDVELNNASGSGGSCDGDWDC